MKIDANRCHRTGLKRAVVGGASLHVLLVYMCFYRSYNYSPCPFTFCFSAIAFLTPGKI